MIKNMRRFYLVSFLLICSLAAASVIFAQEETPIPKTTGTVQTTGKQLAPLMRDGKPIFIIGSYEIPKDCSVSDLKNAGWNTVLLGMQDPSLKSRLEECNKNEIGVIVNLTNLVLKDAADPSTFAKKKEALIAFVKEYSQYPGLYGYYLFDEPENFLKPAYAEAIKTRPNLTLQDYILETLGWMKPAVRSADPHRYTFMCIAWYSTYMKLQSLCDVNMPNEYPTNHTTKEFEGDNPKILLDARAAAVAAEARGLGFVYTPFSLDDNKGIETYRPPTINEFRYSVYAPITEGAMGIVSWAAYRSSKAYANSVIFPVTHELKALSPFFVGRWINEKVKWRPTERTTDILKEYDQPAVSACFRRASDGRYLLLATNNCNAPVRAEFEIDLKGLPRTCRDFITGKSEPVVKGKIGTTLSEYGVRAYIFSTKK